MFPLVEKVCVDLMKEYSSTAYMCPGIILSYGPVVSFNGLKLVDLEMINTKCTLDQSRIELELGVQLVMVQ